MSLTNSKSQRNLGNVSARKPTAPELILQRRLESHSERTLEKNRTENVWLFHKLWFLHILALQCNQWSTPVDVCLVAVDLLMQELIPEVMPAQQMRSYLHCLRALKQWGGSLNLVSTLFHITCIEPICWSLGLLFLIGAALQRWIHEVQQQIMSLLFFFSGNSCRNAHYFYERQITEKWKINPCQERSLKSLRSFSPANSIQIWGQMSKLSSFTCHRAWWEVTVTA